MEQQQPTEAQLAATLPIYQFWLTQWAGFSDETKASFRESQASGWTKSAEGIQEFQDTFGAADTNGDGILDEHEFAQFLTYLYENQKARHGNGAKLGDLGKTVYDIYNSFTAGTEGVSKADIQLAYTCQGLHIAQAQAKKE